MTMRDVRRTNRATLLRPLYFDGLLNRGDLAARTRLSSATVTNLISELKAEGLVVEVGTEESDGGRPRVQLRLNRDFGFVFGVEVGESEVIVAVFDLESNELAKEIVNVRPSQDPPEVLVERIGDAISRLCLRFGKNGRRALGVGIAVPGVVETAANGSVLIHHRANRWNAEPFGERFHKNLGLPVFIENASKALTQAEIWFGHVRGAENAIGVLWGTGVGAGIFMNGTLYRGAASSPGEWGHTCVEVRGRRCRCGAQGCLEAYIGAEALLADWQRRDPTIELSNDIAVSIGQLADAAKTNSAAAEVIEEAAVFFGVGTANLANLLNLECMVIGGDVGWRLGPVVLQRIKEVVRDQALDYPGSHLSISIARLGPDAVVLGASMLVIEAIIDAGGEPLPVGP
jgi:predicted NBD/HSP70 family sugar kinase